MKKIFLLSLSAFLCSILTGCVAINVDLNKNEQNSELSQQYTNKESKRRTKSNLPKHLIFIGFDGMCAQSIREGATMPNLRKLMNEGSYSLESRTILPSSSACDWASIFMASGIEIHGYTTWGSKEPDLPPFELNENGRFPDVFWEYHQANPKAEIGYIYEWEGMNYLTDPAATDYRIQTTNCTDVAVKYIKEKKPNLCAVVFDQPDATGHKIGWRTPEYMNKLTELDSALGEILQAVKDAGIEKETVIIVTSDHGGIEKGHGNTSMSEMQRPLVFWGKNIKKNHVISEKTVVYDLGATMAYMLNVERPAVWTGRPILSIFEK